MAPSRFSLLPVFVISGSALMAIIAVRNIKSPKDTNCHTHCPPSRLQRSCRDTGVRTVRRWTLTCCASAD